jgi:hypothetical protein
MQRKEAKTMRKATRRRHLYLGKVATGLIVLAIFGGGVSAVAFAAGNTAGNTGNSTIPIPSNKLKIIENSDPMFTDPPTAIKTPLPAQLSYQLDPIPAEILPPGTPIPISSEILTVTNAWLVSDGTTLTAVYAGVSGSNPSDGRFAIVRQNATTGIQTVSTVDVAGAGALTIVNPPLGTPVETSAQTGTLSFTSASGQSGTLNLSSDTASLS